MRARLSAVILAVVVAPVVAQADDENPYRGAKVGDYASYSMTTKIGDFNIAGTITQTVTAKTDKEVTIKVTGKVNGMDIPAQEQKIDLTKPFDPTKTGNLPAGADFKVEKLKEGKEKITVAGKAYDATWTTYKMAGKANGLDLTADIKAWMSKEIPSGLAKMEMTTEIMGMKLQMTMLLTETGNKK